MNQQQVQQLEIDDGNTIQVVDIDRNKPFAIVLPINAGNITFYDVNRNTVEYWNNPLLWTCHLGTLCVASCSQPTSFIKYAIFSIGDEV